MPEITKIEIRKPLQPRHPHTKDHHETPHHRVHDCAHRPGWPVGTAAAGRRRPHPEKSAKAKKSTAKKSKQAAKKKPAAKTNKSNQSELWPGLKASKA
jgi:hypothetical protein